MGDVICFISKYELNTLCASRFYSNLSQSVTILAYFQNQK